jgi:hypothetical protein
MAKPRAKNTRARFTKEVSVMGWIEDPDRGVLLVRQAAGPKHIAKAGDRLSLPEKACPSAKYFWSARKGPLEADVERKEQMR